MNEPNTFRAGDTVTWSEDCGDYTPADGWAMKLTVSGAQTLSIAAAGSYVFTITAAQTATLSAGSYILTVYVERGSGASLERKTISSSTVTVLQNLSTAAAGDMRSHYQRVLDSIKAVIEKRATKADEEVAIAGRSLRRTPLGDLIKHMKQYEYLVEEEKRREKIANGLPSGNQILVHFR